MNVAVVAVTYRGGDASLLWADALRRAAATVDNQRLLMRAIAIDNASGDGTATRLRRAAPWVQVVELPRNVGFAAGCNTGIRLAADADLVVLINPDVSVHEDFFSSLLDLEWPRDLAARGPLVLTPEGRVEQSARAFPTMSTAFFGRTALLSRLFPESRFAKKQLRADPDRGPTPVDWISGATMVIPRDRFDRIGLLDERYFMYWEDADWCRRARSSGFEVRYEPSLVVEHHQGSSSRSKQAATTIAFHRSAFRYWKRHVSQNPASTAIVAVTLGLRCALKLAGVGIRRVVHLAPGIASRLEGRRS